MVGTFEKRIQAAIIFHVINFIDPLLFDIFNPGTEGFPKHGKGSKINLRVSTCIKKPFVRIKVTDVIEIPIEHLEGIFICCLFCQIIKRSVIISHKYVKFNGKIIEFVTESTMDRLSVIAKSLPITCSSFSISPSQGYLNTGNAVYDCRKPKAVSIIGKLPVKHMLYLPISDARNDLRHNVRTDIAAIAHKSCQNIAYILWPSFMPSVCG